MIRLYIKLKCDFPERERERRHTKRIKNRDQLDRSKSKALIKNKVLSICGSTYVFFS